MNGMMMDMPLLLSRLLEHAAEAHGDTQIVGREVDGRIHRYTYAEAAGRIRRLARALLRLGVHPGDRVASLAWNTHRHFELFYAVPGLGAVLNTVNPRLHPDQIAYILEHGGSQVLFVDPATLPIAEQLAARLPGITRVILMAPDSDRLEDPHINVLRAETLIRAEHDDGFEWPQFDERSASILCYTSGTTGNPKGVLYSHRANVLQTLHAASGNNILGGQNGAPSALMPIAPLFHGNGWNMPFIAAYLGAKLVLCGRDFEPASLHALMVSEGVTLAAAVPTVWMSLAEWAGSQRKSFGALRQALSSGSTPPDWLFDTMLSDHGVQLTQCYGMTEAMFATTYTMKPGSISLSEEQQRARRRKSGRGCFGVEMRIVDEAGAELPWDGMSPGHLRLRGPWIASAYHRAEAAAVDAQGWLITGDIATIDGDAQVSILDRSKDVIKSGGEWISSIELERAALSHPDVAAAAVIAVPHPRWQERPLLLVVSASSTLDAASVLEHLQGRVAKWWLPDRIELVDSLPLTGTGKIDKRLLRERYREARSASPVEAL